MAALLGSGARRWVRGSVAFQVSHPLQVEPEGLGDLEMEEALEFAGIEEEAVASGAALEVDRRGIRARLEPVDFQRKWRQKPPVEPSDMGGDKAEGSV
ncbi:hypothetical protein BH23VER1_BH23VER1_17890 [soil metagenome]